MKKDTSGSSEGIHNWLESLGRSDSDAANSSFHHYLSKDTTSILKDQSLESLGTIPYENRSRPSTSTGDSDSVEDSDDSGHELAYDESSPSKLNYTATDFDIVMEMRKDPESFDTEYCPIYDNDVTAGDTAKDEYANEILNTCKQYYRDQSECGPGHHRTVNKDQCFESLPNTHLRNPDHFQPRGSNCYNFQFMPGLTQEQEQLKRKRHESVV